MLLHALVIISVHCCNYAAMVGSLAMGSQAVMLE